MLDDHRDRPGWEIAGVAIHADGFDLHEIHTLNVRAEADEGTNLGQLGFVVHTIILPHLMPPLHASRGPQDVTWCALARAMQLPSLRKSGVLRRIPWAEGHLVQDLIQATRV